MRRYLILVMCIISLVWVKPYVSAEGLDYNQLFIEGRIDIKGWYDGLDSNKEPKIKGKGYYSIDMKDGYYNQEADIKELLRQYNKDLGIKYYKERLEDIEWVIGAIELWDSKGDSNLIIRDYLYNYYYEAMTLAQVVRYSYADDVDNLNKGKIAKYDKHRLPQYCKEELINSEVYDSVIEYYISMFGPVRIRCINN